LIKQELASKQDAASSLKQQLEEASADRERLARENDDLQHEIDDLRTLHEEQQAKLKAQMEASVGDLEQQYRKAMEDLEVRSLWLTCAFACAFGSTLRSDARAIENATSAARHAECDYTGPRGT
jgi:DNA repair exonuclease SbcCD ATPase subunit